jgi:hypothetical protein
MIWGDVTKRRRPAHPPRVKLGRPNWNYQEELNMTSLDRRENAFETEFAHQEELKFRARERAVRALAMWAAAQLGKTGEAAGAYAQEIVAADVTEPTTTIDRIVAALAPKQVQASEVQRMMDRFLAAPDAPPRDSLAPRR